MADTEATDLVRLLRRFGVQSLALAAVAVLVGYTTVGMALALVGCGFLFAPVKPHQVTPVDAPATPEPPGSSASDPGPPGGSRG